MLANEVLSFIEDNDVKFIRLAFTDLFGPSFATSPFCPISWPPQWKAAWPSTPPPSPDAQLRRAAPCCSVRTRTRCASCHGDPSPGRVCRLLCDLFTPQGDPFPMDSRALLRTAARHAKEAGLEVRIGTDCEFYLLDLDDHGRPTLEPHDRGGYMDVAPMDRARISAATSC